VVGTDDGMSASNFSAAFNATSNATSNATTDGIDADRLELLAYCDANRSAPFVYLISTPVWLAFFSWWAYNTHHRHAQHALELHKLLLCIPGISLAFSFLSIFYYHWCPWDRLHEQLVGALWVVVTILKEPVILVCLLMVAKGWCITRPRLEPREVAVASWVIALLYAAVVVQLSIGGWLAAIPQLLMWFILLHIILSSALTNLRIIKAQLLALRTFNIDATTTPAYTKYRMFWVLLLSTTVYLTLDVILFIIAHGADGEDAWLSHSLGRQSLELSTTLAIGYAFRARPFGVLFEQVQQLAVDLAAEMLPQLSTVTIDVAELRGDGTIPWSRELKLDGSHETTSSTTAAGPSGGADGGPLEAPPLLLVLNPSDEPDALWVEGGLTRALVVAVRTTVYAEATGAGASGGAPNDWSGGSQSHLPMASLRELLQSSLPWHGDVHHRLQSGAAELEVGSRSCPGRGVTSDASVSTSATRSTASIDAVSA